MTKAQPYQNNPTQENISFYGVKVHSKQEINIPNKKIGFTKDPNVAFECKQSIFSLQLQILVIMKTKECF